MCRMETIDISNGPDQAAHDLLVRILAEDGRVSIPVDVKLIAQKLGVIFMRLDLDEGVDGLLVRNAPYEPFCAVMDSKVSNTHARFTLARELGHYIHSCQNLEKEEIIGFVDRESDFSLQTTDPEKTWVNLFAAALLMPTQVMLRFWANNYSIDRIADMFDVPMTAVDYRIKNLGLY